MKSFEMQSRVAAQLVAEVLAPLAEKFPECVLGFGHVPNAREECFRIHRLVLPLPLNDRRTDFERSLRLNFLSDYVRQELPRMARNGLPPCFHNGFTGVRYITNSGELLIAVCNQLFSPLALAASFIGLAALRFPVTLTSHGPKQHDYEWTFDVGEWRIHDLGSLFQILFDAEAPQGLSKFIAADNGRLGGYFTVFHPIEHTLYRFVFRSQQPMAKSREGQHYDRF